MCSSGVWQVFHFFYQQVLSLSLRWMAGTIMEGAFHGWDREGAWPLPSLPFVIPSISTDRRNLGKVSVILRIEERFDSQRFCGNLRELAQLCGSILRELLASCLIFRRPLSCATHPLLILRALVGSCRSGQKLSASSALSVCEIRQKGIGFNLFDWDIWFLSAITNFFD